MPERERYVSKHEAEIARQVGSVPDDMLRDPERLRDATGPTLRRKPRGAPVVGLLDPDAQRKLIAASEKCFQEGNGGAIGAYLDSTVTELAEEIGKHCVGQPDLVVIMSLIVVLENQLSFYVDNYCADPDDSDADAEWRLDAAFDGVGEMIRQFLAFKKAGMVAMTDAAIFLSSERIVRNLVREVMVRRRESN